MRCRVWYGFVKEKSRLEKNALYGEGKITCVNKEDNTKRERKKRTKCESSCKAELQHLLTNECMIKCLLNFVNIFSLRSVVCFHIKAYKFTNCNKINYLCHLVEIIFFTRNLAVPAMLLWNFKLLIVLIKKASISFLYERDCNKRIIILDAISNGVISHGNFPVNQLYIAHNIILGSSGRSDDLISYKSWVIMHFT